MEKQNIICNSCQPGDENTRITYKFKMSINQPPYYDKDGNLQHSVSTLSGINYTCSCGNKWYVLGIPDCLQNT